MKKLVLLFAFAATPLFFAQAQDGSKTKTTKTKTTASTKAKPVTPAPHSAAATKNAPAFTWTETTHDFGKIEQNKPQTTTFTFKNTGKTPLVLTNVQGSCGCTATDYSKEPIAPGKSGYVKATYNAAAAGPFSKTVTVTANTPQATNVLTIKGEVVAPTTAPKAVN